MHRRLHLFVCAALVAAAVSACGGNGSTPPSFTISGLGSNLNATVTLGAATTYTIGATETASGGGSVTPGPLTIVLSSPSIGTLSGNTLTTGVVNASGTVKVTDSKTGLSATVKVQVLSTHPATVGDTLTLAGTLTHTIARPLPAPSAIASPTTTTTTVTDVLKIASTTATFNGTANLTDENVVESDVAPLQTLTTTSDAYTEFTPSGTSQLLLELGLTSTDSNGVQDTTTYGAGAGEIDQLPDVNGATFTNTAAQTFSETDPGNVSIARTVAADGSYTENDTYLSPPASTTQANSNLTASITYFAGLIVDVAFGAPSGSGANATIPYTISPTVTGAFQTVTGTIPDWYPTTTIFSDSFAKSTSQTIPTACAVPASVGTTATKVVETTTHLDTALGSYETRTQTAYDAPGFGTVCVQLADTIDSYYDYTGQSLNVLLPGLNLALSSTPIQIDTLSETLGFTSGTVSGSSVVRRSAQSLSPTAALHAVTPVFDRAVNAVYRSRREAFAHYVMAHRAQLAKEFVR